MASPKWNYNNINLSALTDRSEATQKLRLEAVKGMPVLFLASVYMAETYWIGTIQHLVKSLVTEVGVDLVMCFNKAPADYKLEGEMREKGLIRRAIYADLSDTEHTADNILVALKESGISVGAVFSSYEEMQCIVGEIAGRLDLPGNKAESYLAARNKYLSREMCEKHDLAFPKYAKVETREQLESVIEDWGLPLVLKPSSGAGSEGVVKCETFKGALEIYDHLLHELTTNDELNWSPSCPPFVLAEQYMDGAEFDCDLLFWNGECVFEALTDNWPTKEPYFLEDGYNHPSKFDAEKQREIIDYCKSCVLALGFTQGCFHVEAKYTDKTCLRMMPDGSKAGQPLLIEVNPRVGGGQLSQWYQQVYGVSLDLNFFLSACGVPINPPCSETPQCALADYFIIPNKSGKLANTEFLDYLLTHPNVTRVQVTKKVGDFMRGYDNGMPEWIGSFTVKADDLESCMKIQAELIQSLPEVPIMVEKVPVLLDAGHVSTTQATMAA
eukprot:comp20974_c0_seq1/m.28084 comp20974_c0_seq1/g.28084  ORF comp20974_c0_seq1/g.28084 comp20974_c0_seq1/m.28084 type:complete len:498 (-) comp20974_c0_seq1:371-1864(-)